MTEEENELHAERVAIVMQGCGCSYALAQKIANDEIMQLQKTRLKKLIDASKGFFNGNKKNTANILS